MAGGLYTNSEKTPVAGRLKRWACEASITEWAETKTTVCSNSLGTSNTRVATHTNFLFLEGRCCRKCKPVFLAPVGFMNH